MNTTTMIPCRPVSLRELAIATCTDQHVDCNYSATLYIAPFLTPMRSWKAKLSLFIDIELLCLLFLWAAIKKSKHAIHKSASKKHDGKYTLLTADASSYFLCQILWRLRFFTWVSQGSFCLLTAPKGSFCVNHSYCVKYSDLDCASEWVELNCPRMCRLCEYEGKPNTR